MNAGIKHSSRIISPNSLRLRVGYPRLVWVILLLIGIVLIVLYLGWPTVMALAVMTPDHSVPGDPPDGFSETTLTARDGTHLAAWYAEPRNGMVIILVHGAGGGRETVRDYATMLYKNDYGVLVLSLRGYSGSEGRINRLGWNSGQDIGAAVEYLSIRKEVKAIGGLGLSMGGEILLGAASQYPEIKAIVADGATFRNVNEYIALPANQPLYRNFTHHIFTLMVRLLSGDQPPEVTILESIRRAETTSFLFIAARNDDTETVYNDLFYRTVSERSSLWSVPEASHTAGFGRYPEEYEQHVLAFFDQVLHQQGIES